MIPFLVGCSVGALVGTLVIGLCRAADDGDQQLPQLGTGTWLVCIDRHGQMTRCEPHVCFEDSFKRLAEAMRKDEL